jgi:hypothetical protein
MWRGDELLVGKPVQRKLFGTTKHRSQDNIKMNFKNIVLG